MGRRGVRQPGFFVGPFMWCWKVRSDWAGRYFGRCQEGFGWAFRGPWGRVQVGGPQPWRK